MVRKLSIKNINLQYSGRLLLAAVTGLIFSASLLMNEGGVLSRFVSVDVAGVYCAHHRRAPVVHQSGSSRRFNTPADALSVPAGTFF